MHITSSRHLRVALVALSGLALASCDQIPSGPDASPSASTAAFDHLGDGATQLAYFSFENVAEGSSSASPLTVAGAIVTATPVTKLPGSGVADLGVGVVNFGDHIFRFSSGIYQNTEPSAYASFQVALASASAACRVDLTRVSFELEHNVVNGGAAIAGVIERRTAAGVLLGSHAISIPFGFSASAPPRVQTVSLEGVTLTSEPTYFRFRMNQNVSSTHSAYTAGLFLDELSFEGRQLCPPTVSVTAPATANEGDAISIATALTGTGLSTSWNLGDGTTGSGAVPATHTYADDGVYEITVSALGAGFPAVTASHTVTVANVAPALPAFAGETILQGETYSASGGFSDPGADTHTATVSYGGAASPLSLSGSSFTLSHTFAAAGTYTVTVVVTDDDGGQDTRTATVTVLSPAQGTAFVVSAISALTSSTALPAAEARSLSESIASVQASLESGNEEAALGKLGSFDNKVDAMLRSRRISTETAASLKAASARLRQSIG